MGFSFPVTTDLHLSVWGPRLHSPSRQPPSPHLSTQISLCLKYLYYKHIQWSKSKEQITVCKFFKSSLRLASSPASVFMLHLSINELALLSANLFSFLSNSLKVPWGVSNHPFQPTTLLFLGVELSSPSPLMRKVLTSLPFKLPPNVEDLFTSEGSSKLATLTLRSSHLAWPSSCPRKSQLRSLPNRTQAPWAW